MSPPVRCSPAEGNAILPLQPVWLGRMDYGAALARQRAYRKQVITGVVPGELWLLEHPPTITTGRREVAIHAEHVRAAGYDLFATERGGLATCHEPGQLVGYLIADVRKSGIRCAVSAIEKGLVCALGRVGIEATRRPGLVGVWVGDAKIAALGLHVSRGVTIHGFALNVENSLAGFELIVPCGIVGGRVTTVAREVGQRVSVASIWPSVGQDVALALANVGVGCDKP